MLPRGAFPGTQQPSGPGRAAGPGPTVGAVTAYIRAIHVNRIAWNRPYYKASYVLGDDTDRGIFTPATLSEEFATAEEAWAAASACAEEAVRRHADLRSAAAG